MQAALAHGAVLFPGPGIAFPAVIWAMNRRNAASKDSAWVRFQALQALAYQILLSTAGALLGLLGLILMLAVLAVFGRAGPTGPTLTGPGYAIEAAVAVLLALLFAGLTLVGMIGGVQCLLGKAFVYPWIGERSAAYLRSADGPDGLEAEREERYCAAAAHSSIMVVGMGWLAPLALWQGDREASPWMKFHAAQALVYQVAGGIAALLVITLWTGTVLLLSISALIGARVPILESAGLRFSESAILLALIPFYVASTLVGLTILAWPIYSTLPLVASYRILKGRDYDYPLVGKRLRKRMLRTGWEYEGAAAVKVPSSG